MRRKISKKLVEWRNRKGRHPLVLRGARQVGKTFLVRELATGFDNYLEVNFEEDGSVSGLFKSKNPQGCDFILLKVAYKMGKRNPFRLTGKEDVLIPNRPKNAFNVLKAIEYRPRSSFSDKRKGFRFPIAIRLSYSSFQQIKIVPNPQTVCEQFVGRHLRSRLQLPISFAAALHGMRGSAPGGGRVEE